MTYSAVPHDALRDRSLIPTDVALLGILLVYARAGATCWPSVRTLMADSARTRRTVQMSLARLKAAGWVAERPADNPTGRVLVLVWRDRGAQIPASPGRNPATRPGAQADAPEWKNQQEEKGAAPEGGEKKAEEDGTRAGGIAGPMTGAERRVFFAASGWLGRPEGDSLRRLAERSIAAAAAPPSREASSGSLSG